MNHASTFVVGSLLFALTGCAGARTQVVAATAEVPVSMSRGVRDADGALVGADRREVVGQFDEDRTAWGMLYSAVKLTPEKDISRAVNEQVQRAHGDAVINVSIATRQCGLTWVPILNLLPFWPGCANVHVRGDIIRVRAASAAAAPPARTSPVPSTTEGTQALARRIP
jgi:hypothetical protein